MDINETIYLKDFSFVYHDEKIMVQGVDENGNKWESDHLLAVEPDKYGKPYIRCYSKCVEYTLCLLGF